MNQTEKKLREIGAKKYYVSTTTEEGETKYLGEIRASNPSEAILFTKLDCRKLTPYEKKHMRVD
jgi:hypothetical protein